MKPDFSKLGKYCAHTLFCAAFVFFFGQNTTLRPPAIGALYKEYISGIIALGVFYFQWFVLYTKYHPDIYRSRFFLASLSCVLVAVGMEALLVYPQVFDTCLFRYPHKTAVVYMLSFCLYMFLRDTGILIASFFVCEFKRYASLCDVYEENFRGKTDEIPALLAPISDNPDCQEIVSNIPLPENEQEESSPNCDKNGGKNDPLTLKIEKLSFLPISEILFCVQMRNTVFIHTLHKQLYFKSVSLKKIISLIGNNLLFQISKDTIVMKKHIVEMTRDHIVLHNPVMDEKKVFKWSGNYWTEELNSWMLKKQIDNSPDKTDNLSYKDAEIRTKTVMGKMPHSALLNQKRFKSSYLYISQNPGCKSAAISKKTKIPIATLNRILAQLKQDGLIEYVGSKKTGGYRAVDKQPDGINTEENGTV